MTRKTMDDLLGVFDRLIDFAEMLNGFGDGEGRKILKKAYKIHKQASREFAAMEG